LGESRGDEAAVEDGDGVAGGNAGDVFEEVLPLKGAAGDLELRKFEGEAESGQAETEPEAGAAAHGEDSEEGDGGVGVDVIEGPLGNDLRGVRLRGEGEAYDNGQDHNEQSLHASSTVSPAESRRQG